MTTAKETTPHASASELAAMTTALTEQLLARRSVNGMWEGRLSSSAISTAVALFALQAADAKQHAAPIEHAADWLQTTMNADGTWGDSPESPSNMTATLLSYAALSALGKPVTETKAYLSNRLGGLSDEALVNGVLSYYGKDLTFSAPILVMCALAGLIDNWNKIPQLPFELAVLPQRIYRFLQLPVVSYAIPALIAVGILRYRKGRKGLLSPLRETFIKPSLTVLDKLQPEHGGFLEAAPLTGFVSLCLCGAGFHELEATQKAAGFLLDTQRKDGSWPIDTNLSSWVTVLSVRALGSEIPNTTELADSTELASTTELAYTIKNNAFKFEHPFTGARKGGWGWTPLPGSVPDADDTAGALVALHVLLKGRYCEEVGNGIEWLLALQNRDGGMPTFCKGWGKLPFDRSSPDISAHALLAFERWMPSLPVELKTRCQRGSERLLHWMRKVQSADGSWTPLWFGDQDAPGEHNPVYGTAMAVEYLSASTHTSTKPMIEKAVRFLLNAQNPDGGWGGTANVRSKVTLTARAVTALATYAKQPDESLQRGLDYLYQRYEAGTLTQPEPIGLYFSRLWYSEELYNLTFTVQALKGYSKLVKEQHVLKDIHQ